MRGWTLMVALLLAGCASGASGGAGRNSDVITRAEIEASNQVNALELIRTERPHWLRRRGSRSLNSETDVVIYLDGTRLGDPASLGQLATVNIEEIRHYSEGEAQFRFGVGHVHGAIDVVTRKGR